MPPKPNALTAARRGVRSGRGQSMASRKIVKGLLAIAIPGAAPEKLAVGGSFLSRRENSTLINPADPAAVSRCPTLLLTDPITQPFFPCEAAPQSCVRLSN